MCLSIPVNVKGRQLVESTFARAANEQGLPPVAMLTMSANISSNTLLQLHLLVVIIGLDHCQGYNCIIHQ